MRLDQLNGLLALAKVAEKRSFSAAALELRVSPSALSQAVRQLESRLGVVLLARTTRSLRLTEAGEVFLERCGPALKEILASVEMVGDLSKTPSGTLRLTLPRIVYRELIEPMLAGFMRAYPKITVELYFEDAFEDIVEQGFDAGIRSDDTLSRDMTVVRLSPPFRWVVAAAPKYFERHGRPKTLNDLLKHDCIRYRFADGDLYEHWEFSNGRKDVTIEVSGSLIVNDVWVAQDAAVQGLGVIYNSERTLGRLLESRKLELVLESHYTKSDGHFLYFPSRSQVQPKLRAFIDYVKSTRAASSGGRG